MNMVRRNDDNELVDVELVPMIPGRCNGMHGAYFRTYADRKREAELKSMFPEHRLENFDPKRKK